MREGRNEREDGEQEEGGERRTKINKGLVCKVNVHGLILKSLASRTQLCSAAEESHRRALHSKFPPPDSH